MKYLWPSAALFLLDSIIIVLFNMAPQCLQHPQLQEGIKSKIGYPNVCGCHQEEKPIDFLALVTRGIYTCGSHRTVTQNKSKDTTAQSFSENSLLVYHHKFSLRGRFLIKHTSED